MTPLSIAITRAASMSIDSASPLISSQFWNRFEINLKKELTPELDSAVGKSGLRLVFIENGEEQEICDVLCERSEIQSAGESSPDPVAAVAVLVSALGIS